MITISSEQNSSPPVLLLRFHCCCCCYFEQRVTHLTHHAITFPFQQEPCGIAMAHGSRGVECELIFAASLSIYRIARTTLSTTIAISADLFRSFVVSSLSFLPFLQMGVWTEHTVYIFMFLVHWVYWKGYMFAPTITLRLMTRRLMLHIQASNGKNENYS